MQKPCIAAKRLASMFHSKLEPHQSAHKEQLDQYMVWLDSIRLQALEWVPQTNASQSDPVLIEAADLLKLIIAFKDSAMSAYQADMKQLGYAQADSLRQLHDATLLCCMFGWLPPMRSSMLISLQIPDQPHACLEDTCNCAGNYLHSSRSPGQLDARWYHHKTARKQQGKPIAYTMPADLSQLLTILLDKANRWKLASKTARTVFVNKKGDEMSPSKWQTYFSGLLPQLGKPLHSLALVVHSDCVTSNTNLNQHCP